MVYSEQGLIISDAMIYGGQGLIISHDRWGTPAERHCSDAMVYGEQKLIISDAMIYGGQGLIISHDLWGTPAEWHHSSGWPLVRSITHTSSAVKEGGKEAVRRRGFPD